MELKMYEVGDGFTSREWIIATSKEQVADDYKERVGVQEWEDLKGDLDEYSFMEEFIQELPMGMSFKIHSEDGENFFEGTVREHIVHCFKNLEHKHLPCIYAGEDW